MYGNQSNKCLITIVKPFDQEFPDELTVKRGQIVQFVSKLDRYWYEVYCDNQTGKVPISSCREWNATEMSSIKLVKNQHAAFVGKFDFMNACEPSDLPFATHDVIIGFTPLNDDWWQGTRLCSVKNSITFLSVREDQCGMFPLTHVWRLREDLLPESAFSQHGIIIEGLTDNESTAQGEQVAPIKDDTHLPATEHFYVRVTKTMEAHTSDEMNLPENGEILLVNSIPDKLYYSGQSLDGRRVGIFPKSFVKIEDNFEPTETHCDLNSTNSSTTSPIPSSNPPTIPPPSPPPISINFGKHISINFADGASQPVNGSIQQDTPPSYEAAICCEPVSYGYANHMFSGIESYGRAIYDFEAQEANELPLRANQIVRLYRHVDDDWMEGEIDGQVGFFPKSYITIIVDCEHNVPQPGDQASETGNQEAFHFPTNTKARILYDFEPEMEHDLRVREGDTVVLLHRFPASDWVEAMDLGGNSGLVHLSFCEMLGSSAYFTPSQPTQTKAAPTHYSGSTSEQTKVEKSVEKGSAIPISTNKSTCDLAHDDVPSSITKPHRAAPPAPARKLNIFPTFNQFVINEKQDIFQYALGEEQVSTPSATTVAAPRKEAPEQSSNANQRQCVITELIQTEKDYCEAMNVCLNVFNSNRAEAVRCNVDLEKLFGTMKAVVAVSKSLLKLLGNYADNRPYVDQRVGICFLDLKFEFFEAYKAYCAKHDSTSMLLRFYEADAKSSDFMRRCQSSIQDRTNCFDLSSIIIKPVQRILKYPLLLNELIKYTEESHIDWNPLLMALQMITDIATSINENKRRHDLIQKYCKNTDTSLSSRLKNLNAHTVKKKSSRIANRIISTLTFSSGHNDESFDAALSKFSAIDKSVKSFGKHMKDYLHNLNEYYVQSLVVANAIIEYYGPRREAEELRATHHEIYTKYFADFRSAVDQDVINLLTKLSDKFKAPWILIQKRKDKLIDYEASLKSKRECSLVKNNFEALNQQLIEELPILTQLSLQVFHNALQSFTSANKILICRTARIFIALHQLPFIKNSPFGFYQDIEEVFRVKHNLVFSQMLHDFSLIHASAFNTSGPLAEANAAATSTFSRLTIHRSSSNTWKNSLPARKSSQVASNVDTEKKVQDASQKGRLLKMYKPEDVFVVKDTYTPCDVFDLYAQAEDIIGVIKRKDPSGQDHRWYVDRGETKGFLPQSILKPYLRAGGSFQSQHSIESCSSLVSSHSADLTPVLLPLPSYENVDLLSEQHRYDTVPEEETHTSLLSFDEIDHPANIETKNSLLEFDPLAAGPSSANRPSSSTSSKELGNSGRSSSSSTNPIPEVFENVYHAAYPFKAADPNQLSMEFGQRVFVKQKCDLQGNAEWWLVINSLGKEGYVPANYLRKNN